MASEILRAVVLFERFNPRLQADRGLTVDGLTNVPSDQLVVQALFEFPILEKQLQNGIISYMGELPTTGYRRQTQAGLLCAAPANYISHWSKSARRVNVCMPATQSLKTEGDRKGGLGLAGNRR